MRIEIENWWEQAKADLRSAENSLKSKDYYVVAFMCQQAIEKGLKATIMLKRKSPGAIHSLSRLGAMAKAPSKFNRFLRSITAEYYISRYPDASEQVPYKLYTEEDVKDILKQTGEFFKWLNKQIKQ